MITITADGAMLAMLRQANEPAEVRDPEGKVVGIFTPVSVKNAPPPSPTAGRIDRTELARRMASQQTGRSTREVFERLKTLTQDHDTLAHLQQKIDGLAE